MLLGLELRHRKQIAQVIEPVPQREPGQMRERFGDETRGFVRAAIASKLDGRPPPALRRGNRLALAGRLLSYV